MLQITKSDVVAAPFPHVVKQDIIDPSLFAALRADFPGVSVFKEQIATNGLVGSRTGSGFDIYRGDPHFTALTERSAAWKEFGDYVNSEAFVDTFRSVFADHLGDIGLKVDIGASRVDPSYVEPRETMKELASTRDKIDGFANKVLSPLRGRAPVDLFTRLDIHKSTGGYAKPAHCDRPNRLCSLIVYFTDPDEVGMSGGDLFVYKHKQDKPVTSYERHPRPENVDIVATIRPKPNLGVFFPCQNNSYHGVSAITSQGAERDFLYINISGRKASLW
ncbi:hypothetical protein GCM10007973_21180 [Polymorphobacter multimanifer]|uniref:Prolyl 4-hydroxylase alpha subunit Fe(2+) 2OG dioxygenase domain-containing protein n=1 Tax=Polymorphobacter multimanifer TaxID=1070431 RepID=A0A841L0D1_9SPHN|nr:2OG-Fe(II) oxygenase [Polymorphobacter multimanifer]MBB6225994.1 hypothetical protein [Polymorphobacter multimanifer]GGI84391.1 hypothetical protein GCM10007973_21180 [Polymorphobacter multimanifer]